MTRDEFNDWYADLSLRFPSTATWLEEKTDTAAVLATWFEVLGEYAHADCLEASKQIQAGHFDLGSWQDTPQVVGRVARQIACDRLLEADRVEMPDLSGYRVSCRECNDSGLIICWDTRTMHAARKEFLEDVPINRWTTCGLPCTCRRGDKFAKWATPNGKGTEIKEHIRYDARRWVRLTNDTQVDRQKLRDWAADYRPPNYSDFGEYGRS